MYLIRDRRPGAGQSTEAETEFLRTLVPAVEAALAPAAAEPTAAALPPELMAASPQSLTPALEPRANFCTKEVCSVNRMACKSDCLPCSFSFQCNFPVCNSCQCLC